MFSCPETSLSIDTEYLTSIWKHLLHEGRFHNASCLETGLSTETRNTLPQFVNTFYMRGSFLLRVGPILTYSSCSMVF